jgi:hypothetical protein
MVRRCRYCPSHELSGVHFRPRDFALLCVGIRRRRCNFCGRPQWTWLLPRPLRWGIAIALVGMLYVATTGPVKWLHDNYRMSDVTYGRLHRWAYWPINRGIAASDPDSSLRSAYLGYLEWWAPAAESMRADDFESLNPGAAGGADTGPARDPPQDLGKFADTIEHETQRPTGEVPAQ